MNEGAVLTQPVAMKSYLIHLASSMRYMTWQMIDARVHRLMLLFEAAGCHLLTMVEDMMHSLSYTPSS